MPPSSVFVYYASRLGAVLRGRFALLRLCTASALHAVGHALVALIASALTLSLTEQLGAPSAAFDHSSPLPALRFPTDNALILSLMGLAIVAVKGAAGVYATFVQARVAGEVGSTLRLELLDALLAVHRLHRPRHGDHRVAVSGTALGVVSLTERVRDVENGLEQGFLGGARAIAQVVPIVAVLLVLSGRMAAVAALVLGSFGWLLARVRSGYRRATYRAMRQREQLVEAADEAVRHADLWVSYGAETKARGAMRAIGESIARASGGLQARAAALSGANEILGAAALVVAVASSRAGWLGSAPDGRTLFAFALSFFLAYRPLRELADARLAMIRAQSAYDELKGIIDFVRELSVDSVRELPLDPVRERSLDRPSEERPFDSPSGDLCAAPTWSLATLELRALRLAEGRAAGALGPGRLAPLSLRIEPGAIVVVVGPTGVGKTTLLRALLGLAATAGGELLFGGKNIGHASAGPLARPFAWVPQDAPLLADTLEANIALGASGADARSVLDALGAGHLVPSIGGARLGAGGRAVSGGERQWIALARAIATRQPVLLLDEPTSGLDAQSQERVLDAIARLRGKRTVLLVTHRTEPLAIADMVVRLDATGAIEQAA